MSTKLYLVKPAARVVLLCAPQVLRGCIYRSDEDAAILSKSEFFGVWTQVTFVCCFGARQENWASSL